MGAKRNMSQEERKIRRKRRRRRLVFAVEILILLFLVVGLFVFAKMDQMQYDRLDKDNVVVNDGVEQNETLKGFTTLALVGIDSREGDLKNSRSDTMIIVSINNDTKKIKLLSVYRDTYLRIGEDKNGNGKYGKANAAYQNGSSEQFLSMLNTNLDLNIQNYMTVDFTAVATVTDLLGGIDIKLTAEEIVHMNNYCVETSKVTGLDYEPIKGEPGVYHLNGVQAVAYSRIRQTVGMDMRRTARQREVILKLVEQVKRADITTLNNILNEVFPMVRTSLSKTELIKLGLNILSYEIEDQAGFPHDHLLGEKIKDAVGVDCVLPITLESNVVWLHEFLYDDKDYVPSDSVKAYSEWIIEKSGYDEDNRLDISEDGNLEAYW